MGSREQIDRAVEIAKHVVDNGRVLSDGTGSLDLLSLRAEVEFECDERGLSDCAEIANIAVSLAK